MLMFDYVSPVYASPYKGDEVFLDEDLFDTLLQLLENSLVPVYEKLRVLWGVSHSVTLTIGQFVRLLKFFPAGGDFLDAQDMLTREDADEPRVEMFVLFFARCPFRKDVCSPTVLYNPNLFTEQMVSRIWNRLGKLHCLDPLHLCQTVKSNGGNGDGSPGNKFTLDLSLYEDWRVCEMLVAAAQNERGESLTKGEYSMSKLAKDDEKGKVSFVPPPGWTAAPGNIPREGKVYWEYRAGRAEYINFAFREELGYRFCNWGGRWRTQRDLFFSSGNAN